jgi:hypothetical protein
MVIAGQTLKVDIQHGLIFVASLLGGAGTAFLGGVQAYFVSQPTASIIDAIQDPRALHNMEIGAAIAGLGSLIAMLKQSPIQQKGTGT